MKQNIYDNKTFFEEYQKMRAEEINANNLIEKPIFRSMLPDPRGKRVLDLGCGAGDLCAYCKNLGASYVLGTDISSKMLEVAKQEYPDITFLKLPMEDLPKLQGKFDFVVSSLAFHYVKDFYKLITDIKSHIFPGGTLLFSQEHPIATCFIPATKSTSKKLEVDGKRYYLVSDYNAIGKRVMHWNIDGVIKYHRTFTEIINTLTHHGFTNIELQESYASDEVIKLEPKYKYQNDRPYFLFVKAELAK